MPLAFLLLLAACVVRAQQPAGRQEPSPAAQDSSLKQATQRGTITGREPPEHRFWDRENDWWFAGVGAGRALDYASTMNLRRRGIDEVFLNNAIVDNHPLFAGIEAGATGASIGVSYLFHRTGHPRLERWTSIVHLSVATGGAIRNYALKTPHPR